MPQDPNLYGQPAPKKQKKEMALSSSLDFTSQLTSLLAKPSSTSHARPRPSKSSSSKKSSSDALFSSARVKRNPSARQPNPDSTAALTLKSPTGTHEETAALASARRKMEEKARLYAAMKRGDYVPGREGEAAPLVDFDRKWAEEQEKGTAGGRSDDSGSDDASSEDEKKEEETVEYTDEFGRLRTATRSQYEAYQRRLRRGQHASAELETMSARPAAPANIIYGEAIQAEAFTVADPDRMEELARKRDRSATPPPETHYDAAAEIRNRGTGFYAFSRDEEARKKEMEGLGKERKETERLRREREEARERRRREVEERRREVAEKRARKMADSFLDRLGEKLASREGKEGEGKTVGEGDGAGGDGVGAGGGCSRG